MSWQQVAIVVVFTAGGVVLGVFQHETLAATLIGAVAGYLSQPLLRPKE